MTESQETREGYQLLAIEELRESPHNPRKNLGDLTELVKSIQATGVLQPLLVRPANGAGGYELVFGHRRFRAAREAGLEAVPAIVREMDDREVLEAQLIENCQRADIHPLEEADGYHRLLGDHGYSIDDLVVKVGKSRNYVYGRLKLLDLTPALKKAFLAGELNPSIALRLARIPVAKLQDQAGRDVAGRTVQEASDIIRSRYMLALGGAPFRTGDAELVPSAGACSTCQHRTGNQRELFADIKSTDVCTDPQCFAAKREAAWRQQAADAKAKGQTVLEGKKADEALLYRSSHVKLDDRCWEDPKGRTWRRLLGKDASGLETALARDSRNHDVAELVDRKAARKVLKAKGHSFANRSTSTAHTPTAADKARQKKVQLEGEARRKIFEILRERLEKEISGPASLTREDLQAIALEMCFFDMDDEVAELLGWREKDQKRTDHRSLKSQEDLATKRIQALSAGELARLLVVLSVARDFDATWSKATALMAAAKRYGINADQIRREVTAAAKAAAKAKPRERPGKKVPVAKCRKCGCTETKACPGGCGWLEPPDPKTGLGLCTSCGPAPKAKRKPRAK